MEILISFFIGIIIGSFPTAYIIIKKTKSIDITKIGSGNVGAMNSYEVTKSKYFGFVVLLIDMLKGFLSAIIVYKIFGDNFMLAALSLNGAVMTHCYSPWIKFKGGKGLATAAGGSLVISLPVLILWSAIWFLSFRIGKEINYSNIAATAAIIIASILIPSLMIKFSQIQSSSNLEFTVLVSIMMLIILSKHKVHIKEIYKSLIKKEI